MRTRLLVVLLPVALAAALAWAQSAARPAKPMNLNGPMTVGGFVTMQSGLSVDGGVQTTSIQADRATVGELDAGSATVSGKTTTGSLEVMGMTDFRGGRPTGIFLAANLVRATGLLVTTLGRWVSVGTVTGSGALFGDACDLTSWPASLAILDVDYRCFVTPTGVVDVQMKAGLALTVPAGTYKTVISGPVPTP